MRCPRVAWILVALPIAVACARPAAVQAQPAGQVDLVESAPIETTLQHPDIAQAYQVWPEMIAGASRALDIAEFYVSDEPDSRLEPTLQAIEAAAGRGVAVRLLADAGFAKKYPETLDRLAARGVTVRRFDVHAVMGGVLHAKYFVVDGREVYLGSQNFDWRSLTHIQEIGARVRDPAVAASFERVFAMDWDLAAGAQPEPPAAGAGAPPSFPETAAGGPAEVTPVFSPKGFLPDARTWELPALIALLDGAKTSIQVQVLTYKTTARDGSPFHELDDALRRAAARGVSVQLLVSDWEKRKGTVESVQSLARVPGISVRFIDIPRWSGGFVPFARVAHAKYMVVDGARAWVGTSNWEGDYFTKTRNVGIVVEGEAFAKLLQRVFHDGFEGQYAEKVDPDATYEAPKTDEKKTDEK
jgi:phosphatidylserine/phosphatidylglycerophosphate/cardiolipin synthase-like enzyme